MHEGGPQLFPYIDRLVITDCGVLKDGVLTFCSFKGAVVSSVVGGFCDGFGRPSTEYHRLHGCMRITLQPLQYR